jgi:hypothetical protein
MSDANFSGFPHGKLIKIHGKPFNTSLQVLKCQLYNHAASIPSRRGGGAHGYLGIVRDADWYIEVSGNIAWVTPKHPGYSPNLTLATTAVHCEKVTRQYNSDLLVFELYNRPSNAFEQQLLLSVNSTFLRA